MNSRTIIATAGNVYAPALGVLRELGYSVARDPKAEGLYRAENDQCSFVAEDPLLLLGLVKLYEVRGSSWQPSDSEISDLLSLERGDA